VFDLPDKGLAEEYYMRKSTLLLEIERLLLKEREGIVSSNLELLNDSIRKIEEVHKEVDALDRKNRAVKIQLKKDRKNQIKDLLASIVKLSRENELLLIEAKNSLLSELKNTKLKKRVRGAYNNKSSEFGMTSKVG
jgi:hypothetical protein